MDAIKQYQIYSIAMQSLLYRSLTEFLWFNVTVNLIYILMQKRSFINMAGKQKKSRVAIYLEQYVRRLNLNTSLQKQHLIWSKHKPQ